MKEKILSLTKDDFEWKAIRSGGPGGQHRNKVATGIRVFHRPSGARAEATEERSQFLNQRKAFQRITSDPTFKLWLKITAQKLTGIPTPEEMVEKSMKAENLKIEVRGGSGKWEEVDAVDLGV